MTGQQMTDLNEIVRNQIMNEGPQFEVLEIRDGYIDSILNCMTNVELLVRISDAIEARK
jgi:hypothetical protein